MTVCNVCGSSDLNLIDGFYYCVECGTQDTEARLTEMETKDIEINPYLMSRNARVEVRKVTKQVETKDNVEMSGEWHKWHAYNFILCGIADQLIGLGAKPSFKRKLLWIWSRYVRKYQIKKDFGAAQHYEDKNNTAQLRDDDSEDEVKNNVELNKIFKNEPKGSAHVKAFTTITIKLFFGMINAALNLDRSDILPSHLVRFIEEGKISAKHNNYWRHLPKDICTKNIANWSEFYLSLNVKLTPITVITMTYICMHYLNLGTPVLPDMRNLLNNCVKELCLPKEFKDLVVSLMHMFPCDPLIFIKFRVARMPDYEAFILGYIMVALKICFGLDSDYDVRLTDVVDKINIEQEYEKSFKDVNSVRTGRLFSLREWYNHLQIREVMLSKHIKVMSSVLNFPCDDYVVLDHTERGKSKYDLTSELIADIINKIPTDVAKVIPQNVFPVTLTPMTDHTEVIAQYIMDPDIKMLLLEDFTQYSLKYACKKLKLKHNTNYSNDLFKGVNESHKIAKGIMLASWVRNVDTSMVYVRNCENKNWTVTKPPTLEHINEENVKETTEIDHDRNSNSESSLNQSEDNTTDDTDFKLYVNSEETNIFDDTFDDFDDEDVKEDLGNLEIPEPDLFISQQEWIETHGVQDSASEIDDHSDSSLSDNERERYNTFNPETFDRQKVIKELILMACNKYKICVPKEYKNNPLKRKWINDRSVERKRKKNDLTCTTTTNDEDNTISVTDILSSYYESIENDIITKISENVKTAIQNATESHERLQNEPENIEHIDEGNVKNDAERIEDQSSDVILDEGLKDDESDEHSDDTIEDIDVNDLLPRENPNFDGKTHEQDQLYLKVNSQFDDNKFKDLFLIKDKEISDVLKEKVVYANNLTIAEDQHSSDYDSEDDLPLGVFKEIKILHRERTEKHEAATKYLIKNRADIKTFKYWMRFYTHNSTRNYFGGSYFEKELKEHYPGSFQCVLKKCAHILNVPTLSVYTHMSDLESRMVFYAKKHSKLNGFT